jgi:4,5-DOPA dioxygenase extradiol
MSDKMPAIFFGHGNPLNALDKNTYTRGWEAIGKSIPTPRAIVSISAHWYTRGTQVTAMPVPRTIHDFGGFPKALYEVQYPAPGDPILARQVQQLLQPLTVGLDTEWGLDHGSWSVLCHVFPEADVPVLQLSIDRTQPAAFHYELGRRLAPLRHDDVLFMGSGNLVHNLHTYAWGKHPVEPFDWALRFEQRARELLLAGEHGPLINYESLGPDALLSIPTPEHYLPLLYVLGMQGAGESVYFPVTGIEGGSISMLAVQLGNSAGM